VQGPERGDVVEVAEAGGLYRHYERHAACGAEAAPRANTSLAHGAGATCQRWLHGGARAALSPSGSGNNLVPVLGLLGPTTLATCRQGFSGRTPLESNRAEQPLVVLAGEPQVRHYWSA
jgi:hypothetical protein